MSTSWGPGSRRSIENGISGAFADAAAYVAVFSIVSSFQQVWERSLGFHLRLLPRYSAKDAESMAHLPRPLKLLLDLPPGERRLGPFLLVAPLGRGGFAPVLLARAVGSA